MEPLRHHTAWKALSTHYEAIERLHLRDLFARDPGRGERLTAEGVGLFLDFSKHRITDRTIELLIELAEESGLRSRIDAMCRGNKITSQRTEQFCTSSFAHRTTHRSSSMERTLCPVSTRCSSA
jgi:hypothetical protein